MESPLSQMPTERVEPELEINRPAAHQPDAVEQMQRLLEYCPTAIAMLDRDMRYLLVSQEWHKIFALNEQDIIGCSHYVVCPGSDRWKGIYQRCLAGATERCDEEAIPRADGSIDWLKWEIRPWQTSANTIGGIIIFAEVITQQKRLEFCLEQTNQELEAWVDTGTAELQQTVEQLKHSNQRLELLVQQSPIAIIEWDAQFEVTEWNPASEHIFGYSRAEAVGRCFDLVVPENLKGYIKQLVKTTLSQTETTTSINENITKDGRSIICEWHNTPLVDANQTIIGVASMAIDITEREQAETALRDSEARHRALLEALPDMMFRYDRQGTHLDFVPSRDWDTAIAPEAFLGVLLSDVLPAPAAQQILAAISQALDTGKIQLIEYQLEFDGIVHDYEARLVASGEDEVTTIVRDISEPKAAERDRKAAETALRFEKEFTHVVIESVSNGVVACDANGQLKLLNQTAREWHSCDLRSLPPEEWASFYDLYEADGVTPLATEKNPLLRAFKGESVREAGMAIAAKDQPIRYILANGDPLFDAEQRQIGAVAIMHDITERKQAEAALAESEAKFRRLVENANDLIWASDLDGILTYLSPNTKDMMGYEPSELWGQPFVPLVHPDDLPKVMASLEQSARTGEKASSFAFRNRCKDGSWCWMTSRAVPVKDADGNVIGFQGILRDISESKQAEAQLKQQAIDLEYALQELQQTQAKMIQSEKMSSLGQLVAGVAHEINNPVNFIYGNLTPANDYIQDLLKLLNLYQQVYPTPHPAIQDEMDAIDLDFLVEDLPKVLSSMRIGADRIQKIVASLRTFSRMDEAEMKEVNIHDGIDSTLMILQSRIKAKDERPEIAIIKHYDTLPLVECYAGQLNQVFMNILSNAIDAIEESFELKVLSSELDEMSPTQNSKLKTQNSPTITIHTHHIQPDSIQIRIADNGPGIPEHIRQRLFDPFFTTKPVGKGTGMGLSISYQIVTEKHGGTLHCVSEPGQGTEFVIQIPLRQ